jgi:ABC-type molybdate transport system permease subunit
METQAIDVLAMAHLIVLSMWGGVVATEAVIEIFPFRRRELHAATIRFHYWIDLLVELPLVLAVIATGIVLLCAGGAATLGFRFALERLG